MKTNSTSEQRDLPPKGLDNDMIRCTRCGTIAYEDDRFCPCCGTTLVRQCDACGSVVRHPVARYCTACGSPLDGRLLQA